MGYVVVLLAYTKYAASDYWSQRRLKQSETLCSRSASSLLSCKGTLRAELTIQKCCYLLHVLKIKVRGVSVCDKEMLFSNMFSPRWIRSACFFDRGVSWKFLFLNLDFSFLVTKMSYTCTFDTVPCVKFLSKKAVIIFFFLLAGRRILVLSTHRLNTNTPTEQVRLFQISYTNTVCDPR
jgi:hypothetical protein